VKRTLLTVALLTAGVAAFGRFETGDGIPKPPEKEWAWRNEALRGARVFVGRFNAADINFAKDPNEGSVDPILTTCKYTPDESSGTTPKFDCELPNGEKVKVKYGGTKEVHSETAATRLLHALGFGADRVSRVQTVRCHGCPFQPYHTRALAELLQLDGFYDRRLDYDTYRDFENVSVERNLEGEAIEIGAERGWAFYELKNISEAKGGATRSEIDALRLIAVFLHHWDNKTSNQRLICVDSESTDCKHPIVMIQDVGSEFGPKKVELDKWRSTPVWSGDASTCTLSMREMPYKGGTFEDVAISDEGRRLLGDRLNQLTPAHIESLFVAGGFEQVPEWVNAFRDKVRQITNRPACPAKS
jgi:hypothetical protein